MTPTKIFFQVALLCSLLLFLVYHKYVTRETDATVRRPRIRDDVLYQIPITWDLPWFFRGGTYEPSHPTVSSSSLWPANNSSSDRIVEQLMYVPKRVDRVKSIFFHGWPLHRSLDAAQAFKNAYCPVHNCTVATSMNDADAVVFNEVVRGSRKFLPSSQIWILSLLESPYQTPKALREDTINWTASYRSDSEIVTPYGKWVYYDEAVQSKEQGVNYAFGKTGQVAWMVSNCRASNNRMEFALELKKYISVDIYGRCGRMVCPRREIFDCYEMFRKRYKFYLSFENGNCIEYITEKFFYNGLGFDVLPIVMGARPEDYRRVAPRNSYIHVEDFPDVASLAAYLHRLDRDDDLYNSYFAWKGTGEFINTHFLCRLCAVLHSGDGPSRRGRDLRQWWRGPGTCVKDRWTDATTLMTRRNKAIVTQNR